MRITRAWLLCAVASSLAAQPVPIERIRQRLAQEIVRLANYKCTEAVERERRLSPDGPVEVSDTVRLDVAYIGGHEIYAWPDGSPFQEGALQKLMAGGTTFNGLFALFAKRVLASPGVQVRFAGSDPAGKLLFLYEVPPGGSDFTVDVGRERALTGYRGSFAIDRKTLDASRLEVLADTLPPDLALHSIRMIVEYERTSVGAEKPLLPRRAQVEVRYQGGELSSSRVTFDNCRQYAASSTLSFAEAAADATPRPAIAPVALPRNLRLEAALDADVDLDACAAGDGVRALLARPAVAAKERLAEAGAAVEGRVERVERRRSPMPHVLLTVRFHTLEAAGGPIRFRGRVEGIKPAEKRLRAQVLRPGKSVEYRLSRTYGRFVTFVDVPDTGLVVIEGTRLARGTVLRLRAEPERR